MRRVQCFIAIYRLVEHKTSGSLMPNSYHLHFCIQFFLCKEKAKKLLNSINKTKALKKDDDTTSKKAY